MNSTFIPNQGARFHSKLCVGEASNHLVGAPKHFGHPSDGIWSPIPKHFGHPLIRGLSRSH